MLLRTTTVIAAGCLLLAGCGLFGKDKLVIDGERIPVLESKEAIVPDYSAGDIKIALPAPYVNHSWTQTGGNASHSMGHLSSAEELQEKWSASFGDGNSSRDYLIAAPVMAGERVYTIDTEARVSAFDRKTGHKIWSRRVKPKIRMDKEVSLKGAGLAYDKGLVFAVTGFGGVFALNENDGGIKWSYFAKTPIRIAPVVGSGKVFIQTIDNVVIALNGKTGTEIWRYAAPSEETTVVGGAAPAYSAETDVLIAGFNNGELRAIKASTGSPLWGDYLVPNRRNNSLADINAIRANPVIAGDHVYAVGNNNLMAAIDLRSGQRLWEREIGSSNQPWVAGKYMFVMANNAALLAMDIDSGKIIWETKIPAGNDISDKVGVSYAGPLLTNNRLLVNTSNGYTFYISPYTGEILGFIQPGDGSALPSVAADGMVIITTNNADIIAYQ